MKEWKHNFLTNIYLLRKRIREEAVSGKRGRKVESNLRKERTRERKKWHFSASQYVSILREREGNKKRSGEVKQVREKGGEKKERKG